MLPNIWIVLVVCAFGGMLAVGIDRAVTMLYHKGSKDNP